MGGRDYGASHSSKQRRCSGDLASALHPMCVCGGGRQSLTGVMPRDTPRDVHRKRDSAAGHYPEQRASRADSVSGLFVPLIFRASESTMGDAKGPPIAAHGGLHAYTSNLLFCRFRFSPSPHPENPRASGI
jgi:hypothetical protein